METITVPAIYRNGVLEPQVKLDLPDNTPVEVQVSILVNTPQDFSDELIRSLYGKYAEGPSLLDALFEERASERKSEDAKGDWLKSSATQILDSSVRSERWL